MSPEIRPDTRTAGRILKGLVCGNYGCNGSLSMMENIPTHIITVGCSACRKTIDLSTLKIVYENQ